MPKILARPPEEIPFWKLAEGGNVFLIPTYQRPFAWDRDRQVKDFWEDIYTSFKTNNSRSYLFGNIYLAPVKSLEELKRYIQRDIFTSFFGNIEKEGKDLEDLLKDLEKVNFYLIVDGQQRTTTFFLLIKALHDAGIKIPERKRVELIVKLDSGEELPKLILGSTDAEFFKKLVSNEEVSPETLSNKRLMEAYSFLKSKINSLSNEEKEEFIKYLINYVNIIRSEISSLEYATILFISQTDRGKELTYLERLKSLLSFYVYTKLTDSDKPEFLNRIDKTFSKTFELLDSLAEERVFSGERDVEEYFFKIIKIIEAIESNGNLRDARRISADKAYEAIRISLRNRSQSTSLDDLKRSIENYVKVVEEINQLFDYIIRNLSNPHFASVFKLLRPSPQTYAFLSKLHSKYPDLKFEDKCFKWKRNHTDLEEFFEAEKTEILKGIDSDKNISQQEKDFLKKKLRNITYNKRTDYISILNLVELLELAVWKVGKEPVETFKNAWKMAFNSTSEQGVINAFRFLEGYRYNYLDNFANFGFIYNEYERTIFNNDILNEILADKLSVEHIFPQEEKDIEVIKDSLKDFGFTDLDDYKRFVEENPGNWILLRRNLNSKVKNLSPLNKGFKYVGFFSQKPQGQNRKNKEECIVKSVERLGKELVKLAQLSNNEPSPAFRYLLEIRRLELTIFLYERFI